MIIDIHVHQRLTVEGEPPGAELDALLASADRAGVDRLCLLGNVLRFGTSPSAREVRKINDATLACVEARPERLIRISSAGGGSMRVPEQPRRISAAKATTAPSRATRYG